LRNLLPVFTIANVGDKNPFCNIKSTKYPEKYDEMGINNGLFPSGLIFYAGYSLIKINNFPFFICEN